MALGKRDRQQAILAELHASPSLRISELARRFHVVTETIRRDLDELGRRGLLSRTYGGAAGPPLDLEPSLDDRYRTMVDQRFAIARAVPGLLRDGATIMIDSGATTIYVARRLAAAMKDITVITTSFGVATALAVNRRIRVIVCPGEFDTGDGGVGGPDTLAYLRRFNPAYAIIGASRVDAKGPSDDNSVSAWNKRVMIEQAEAVLLVADSSKFEQAALEHVCALDVLDYLVTDGAPSPRFAEALESAEVAVKVGEPKGVER
jgi:DeoR/GlpR family transcriptional regulator of sugar metabolism